MFDCIRCSRIVEFEECYLIFDKKYCRACAIFIDKSPEYRHVQEILKVFEQIEN